MNGDLISRKAVLDWVSEQYYSELEYKKAVEEFKKQAEAHLRIMVSLDGKMLVKALEAYQQSKMAVEECIKKTKSTERHYGSEWIPCKDRLPEKSGEYIVMIKGAELPTCLYFLRSDNSWFDLEMIMKYEVSHWQPLPEPYHEP